MSTQHRRSARRLAGTTVAASLLVATVAASAQAATPTITVTQAKTTVPAAKLMPGSLKLVVPVHTTKSAIAAPCLTKPKVITLKANTASGVYLGKETSIFSPKYLQWDVTVVVFPSAAKAAAAAATLTAAEKVCPKTSTRTVKDTTETWTRSLGTKYTVGSFKGFRSVEHLTAALYGCGYERPAGPAQLRAALERSMRAGITTVIEIRTERRENRELHRRILDGEAFHAAVVMPGLLRCAVHQIAVVTIGDRTERAGDQLDVDAAAVAHGVELVGGERAGRMVREAPGHAALVVDRHPGMAVERVLAVGRNDAVERHDPLRDAPIEVALMRRPTQAA